jgi:ABC-type lipoprotein export system ATPase subunit
MALIRTEKLTKSVPQGGGRLWLLRDVDLEVADGEFVSIMGPSGAGKTTLLHILGMHDGEFEGSYSLDGTRVESLAPKQRADLQRRSIGFVFQSYHLIDDLTVAENLDVPLRYRDVPKRERESIVADVLDRFRIVAKKGLYPAQLSGGQQQLVGVARAIISNPKIILADEPTGNLHSDQAREIMELFRTLHQAGTTIVQVTHSEENAAFGDRVIRLHDGRVMR